MTDPIRSFRFEHGKGTDVGQVRNINEDSLLALDDAAIWLVADGMGGHAAGDFASQTIVDHMETLGVPASREDMKQRFVQRLTEANRRIMSHASELGRGSIGTTVAALMVFDNTFACFWSGDSRVYRMREGVLNRVSKDHTEVQALIDAGTISVEDAASWPRKNVITRAIGVSDPPAFEVLEGRVADGDLFLICSDGLTEYFADSEIEKVLSQPSDDLDALSRWFVNTAVERGGKDNVTVVVMRCIARPAPEVTVDGMFPEFGGRL
jgi:protein phosphatase